MGVYIRSSQSVTAPDIQRHTFGDARGKELNVRLGSINTDFRDNMLLITFNKKSNRASRIRCAKLPGFYVAERGNDSDDGDYTNNALMELCTR